MLKCDTDTGVNYDKKSINGCSDMSLNVAECGRAESIISPALSDPVANTIAERGERYGSYPEQGRISQNIKRAMTDSPNWATLSDDKKEALEIIAVKMGRILNGDPEYADSWHDIAGYAKLAEDNCNA